MNEESPVFVGFLPIDARKCLTQVVQLLQVNARLAELEISAGERPRAGDATLPKYIAERIKEWAEGEESAALGRVINSAVGYTVCRSCASGR